MGSHPNQFTPASEPRRFGRIDLRVPEASKARWQKAAHANGVPLTKWMEEACDSYADRLFPRQAKITKTYARSSTCPRWMYHQVGVYCPGCDEVIPG